MSEAKLCRRDDLQFEKLPDGSAVLYDKTKHMAYPLTASAARIWDACDGTRSRPALVDDLAERYDAPRDVIERDVDAFVKQLAELELLAPRTGAGA